MVKLFLFRYRVPIILFLWVFVIQMFCNKDSYFYAQLGQHDSATFFMGGKALVKGMVPYVEFSDSKGLLLWFLYGIGYLIDPYSYIGIFWIVCIVVWITLIISYKTARLWLNQSFSLGAAMFLLVPLFYWNFYYETKSEHFCWPFVAWGIYVLLRIINGVNCKSYHYALLGVGIVACLMIKWSIAIMMMSLICSIALLTLTKSTWRVFFNTFFFGVVFALCPFVIYFSIQGNFQDMIREYFINTYSTVKVPLSETLSVYANEWRSFLTSKGILYLLYIIPSFFIVWKKSQWFSTSLFFLSGLFFVSLSIHHNMAGYYLAICGPFAIVLAVFISKLVQRYFKSSWMMYIICVLSICYIVRGSIKYSDSFCTKVGGQYDELMAIGATFEQNGINKEMVFSQERSLNMASSIPATNYWVTQMGKTPQMWEDQLRAISERKADYIVVNFPDGFSIVDYIEASGYKQYANCYAGLIFVRELPEEELPIKHFSTWDIIFKRTYFEL